MSLPSSPWFAEAMSALLERKDLSSEIVSAAIRSFTSGRLDQVEAAAFLVALRIKGESAGEIGATAAVLREQMIRLTRMGPVLDTCGTGGDGSGTFNISTAVALVVSASGCAVVKHGNRSVSSRSGSADVLKELGVPIENGTAWAQKCLDRLGFAFCFAPQFHPALAALAPLRRKLGIRTVFNLVGPLLNPASADFQLLGVGRRELLDPLAEAASQLGLRQAFLVSGDNGLDEVSLSGPTQVRWARDGRVDRLEWTPDDFGLEPCRLEELKADSPGDSARLILELLKGRDGAPKRMVLANAAAALLAAQRVASLTDGVQRAAAAIEKGDALRLLEQLRASG